MTTRVSDEKFVEAWQRLGSPKAVAEELGLAIRGVYDRRAHFAKRGIYLPTAPAADCPRRTTDWSPRIEFVRRRPFEVTDGTVIVFSDPHWLPDHSSVGQDALELLIRELKPKLIVCGGDAVDGDRLSRYDPTRGHAKRFTVRQELDCVVEHFDAIDAVAGKAKKAWCLGNHDVRLSRYVAVHAPELLDMPAMRLEDWIPKWPLSWTVEINAGTPAMTVCRHRNQSGMLHLQGMRAGTTYCHGHLHRLNVHVQPTFNGYRYSVDAGSLADPTSSGFDYTEGNVEHVQGFAVFTYRKGHLLMPELCYVDQGRAYFRGAPV